jgi:hypothetical protein
MHVNTHRPTGKYKYHTLKPSFFLAHQLTPANTWLLLTWPPTKKRRHVSGGSWGRVRSDSLPLNTICSTKATSPTLPKRKAAREAVYKLRERYVSVKALNTPMQGLFELSSLVAITPAEKLEAESVKYDAVRDLIRMVAIRKAQALTAQQERNGAIPVKFW